MFHPISKKLIQWYGHNKRTLPWRDVADPYCIWISEIILQQTRVSQGTDYYLRFVNRFPNVIELAGAHQDEVLKYWQGLGYYSRARNLHQTAKVIVEKFNGEFPHTHAEILSLKGIGEYTAAAICSFAYNMPYAVVDGNVYRVISRVFGIDTPIDSAVGKKEFAITAQQLLNKMDAGTHNQAIMEFGALHCVPVKPDCLNCTLKSYCKAYELELTDTLPIKQSKIKVRTRFFNYLFIRCQSNVYMRQRNENDVWQQLYEFPLIESDRLFDVSDVFQSKYLMGQTGVSLNSAVHDFKHILSHQRIFARFFSIEIQEPYIQCDDCFSIDIDAIHQYPISRLMELFLEKVNSRSEHVSKASKSRKDIE